MSSSKRSSDKFSALAHLTKGEVPCRRENSGSSHPIAAACAFRKRFSCGRRSGSGATPRNTSPAATPGSTSDSAVNSATSTPIPSLLQRRTGRHRIGRKRARSFSSVCAPRRPISAVSVTSATRSAGASPSTPTATSAMHCPCSRPGSSLAHPRRLFGLLRSISHKQVSAAGCRVLGRERRKLDAGPERRLANRSNAKLGEAGQLRVAAVALERALVREALQVYFEGLARVSGRQAADSPLDPAAVALHDSGCLDFKLLELGLTPLVHLERNNQDQPGNHCTHQSPILLSSSPCAPA